VEASSANNHLGEISRSKLEKKCNKKLNFLRINFTLWQLFVYISNGYGGFDNWRILQLINFISIEFLIYVVMIQSPVDKKDIFERRNGILYFNYQGFYQIKDRGVTRYFCSF